MQSHGHDDAAEKPPVDLLPAGVLRLVRLARQGALRAGDTVATRRLGECEVTCIHSPYSISVRNTAGQHYLLSGLYFGPGVRMADVTGGAAP